MPIRRILVLTDTMPWGHRSIARAIYGYLKSKEKEDELRVDYAEVDPKLGVLNDAYTLIYRTFPATNRVSNRLMEYKPLREIFKETAGRDLEGLRKMINRYKPKVVISCYFFHTLSLAKWKAEGEVGFKLWTVVTDPWSINPVSLVEEADMHLVYDKKGIKEAGKWGIDEKKVTATGWWVREEMYRKISEEQKLVLKRKLGFKDKRPIVFVGGGSLGTNAITRLLPALLMVKKKVGLIINTGTDKMAYNLVEEYVRIFRRIRQNDMVAIKNMGWIDNMGEMLAISDIVFGKAGPNFLFDVVAAEKPFVAITHIGGQEDGNIELIKKKKLGWVKEKRSDLVEFFLDYVESPRKYNRKYEKTIKEEARSNKRGLEKIRELLKKNIPPKV